MKYDGKLIQDILPPYEEGALDFSENKGTKMAEELIEKPINISAKMLSKKIRRRRILIFTSIAVAFAIMVGICLSLFLGQGKIGSAKIKIGTSTKFSNAEIQSAADCVLAKFKEFKGCNLEALWYDEKSSDLFAEDYMSSGKGSVNGVKSGNVIILLSNFKVNSEGGDGSFSPGEICKNWNWILIRDSKTGKWRVDDWGY